MRLTKFSHSCVRVDNGSYGLVIDPGVLSEAREALIGASAVLVTHEHPDHVDVEALREAAGANPALRIWAPSSVSGQFVDLGDRVTTVSVGETFEAAGLSVQTFGGQHALIHPTVPVVANIGYLVEGLLYHPGDSLIVPTAPVDTLLAPIHAPWSRVAEVIDFVVSVRAPRAFQIHDALLNERGVQFTEAHVDRIGGWHGTEFRHLQPRDRVEF
jgi:L-ascorbate metabolism protein UlaG (beta-lactamase superfamily)